ncbi:hypothetical protein LPTSP3_g07610 [Leptospira kobayashii]|uniref:Yip1 domain protein n=1 Tax=Leptospira kobayashii TaxID=1917830 RepID=A0ABM7UGS0_9LEPT|nr:hypothetical protein [Leptospira kobayashii]BDA77831.1 hypothetical protein LPTSP3_g07610 [Leptospira kobayashii]
MDKQLQYINRFFQALFRPTDYFQNSKENHSFIDFLKSNGFSIYALVLFCLTIVLAGTDIYSAYIVNDLSIRVDPENQKKILQQFGPPPAKPSLVWIVFQARLRFIIFWILFPAVWSVIRYLFLKLLNAKNKIGYYDLFSLTLAGFFPLLFISGLASVYNGFTPLSSFSLTTEGIYNRVIVIASVFALTWIWEALIFTKGISIVGKEEVGRGIMVWIFPSLLSYFFISLFFIFANLNS